MQLLVKYSINLKLQMRTCQILSFVTSDIDQDNTFVNQPEEFDSQGIFISVQYTAFSDYSFQISNGHLEWNLLLQVRDFSII